MGRKGLLIALLGFPGWAPAAPADPDLADETYIRRQFERNQERSREIMRIRDAKRKEFLERSHIGGAGDTCLAYAIETGDCPISAGEFDRALVSHLPESLEFLSGESLAWKASQARRSVFEQLFDRAFLDAYQPDGSLRLPGSEARKIRAQTHAEARAEARGIPDGYDLPTLLKAFPEIRVQVAAASDSAWLATRWENPRGGIMPITMPAWELPDSIAALLAHYPPGEWTPIRRVPFGFLACSWLDSLPARESLAKIRPRWDRSASESVSQRRSRAIEALRKQGEGCRDEDTLGLSLRLAPAFRRPAQEPGPTWLGANSSVLPASVKSRVWMKSRPGARDTVGPFRSVYGTWMLAPSPSDVKPGRTLDSTACLARAEAGMRKEEKARRIRSEWEILASEATSKMDSDRNDVRTALLEQLAKRSSQPESSYREMRERWASRSLRFTRDMGFLDAAPETGKGRTE